MPLLTENASGTLVASGARTAAGNSGVQTNRYGRGVQLVVNVTAASGTTPTLAFTVNAVDPVTGDGSVVAAMAAAGTNITATGQYLITVYPTAATGGNLQVNAALPRLWQLNWAIGGTTPSFTFTVGYHYLV